MTANTRIKLTRPSLPGLAISWWRAAYALDVRRTRKSGGILLRKDTNAHFEKSGFFSSKYTFVYAKRRSTPLRQADYDAMLQAQSHEPACIVDDRELGRKWWLFKGEFYWEDERLSRRDVKALILDRNRKAQNRVELAVAKMDGAATPREHIPSSVESFVWNRDGGKCVRCGSKIRLEFDHIIPLAKGGSNSPRNLQLLCEQCNRSKGAQIG